MSIALDLNALLTAMHMLRFRRDDYDPALVQESTDIFHDNCIAVAILAVLVYDTGGPNWSSLLNSSISQSLYPTAISIGSEVSLAFCQSSLL